MRTLSIFMTVGMALAQPQTGCDPALPCLTFLPQAKAKGVIPWSIMLCAPQDYQLPIGRIYSIMVEHAIPPLTYSNAVAVLTARQHRSPWYRVALYAGWAAAGAAVILSMKQVQARPAVQEDVGIGSGFLNVLVPLAQKQEPSYATLISQLSRDTDSIHPSMGGCAQTVVLGPLGSAFNVQMIK